MFRLSSMPDSSPEMILFGLQDRIEKKHNSLDKIDAYIAKQNVDCDVLYAKIEAQSRAGYSSCQKLSNNSWRELEIHHLLKTRVKYARRRGPCPRRMRIRAEIAARS